MAKTVYNRGKTRIFAGDTALGSSDNRHPPIVTGTIMGTLRQVR